MMTPIETQVLVPNNSSDLLLPSPTTENSSSTKLAVFFKQTQMQRNKKLSNFFGEDVLPDVAIAEIEKFGLMAILQSRVPLSYFLYKLLEDLSSENLFFYLEVDHFENKKFKSDNERYLAARHVFEIYLDGKSLLEINIEDKMKKDIAEGFKSKTNLKYIFAPAKQEVLELLEKAYISFVKSPVYKRMKDEIDGAHVFTKNGREKATRILAEHLDKHVIKMDIEGRVNQVAHQHHLMVKHMVSEFSRAILRTTIDFVWL